MRATLDWSYALLAQEEQALLARLAVFRGSFPLAAAEAVGVGIGEGLEDTFDLLSRLVDHSLVVAAPTGDGEARYLLHEVIRQSASERLAATSDEAEARDRHLAFYVTLAGAASAPLRSARRREWLDRLEQDLNNLREARDWARSAPGHAEAGLRLAAALNGYWMNRGGHAEARSWVEEALAVAQRAPAWENVNPIARAGALLSASEQAFWSGDVEAAYPLAEESLALYQTVGEVACWNKGDALHTLAYLREYMKDPASSRLLFVEALEIWSQLGDPWGMAMAQGSLARQQARSGDREGARRLFEEARRNVLLAGDQGLLSWVLWQWSRAEAALGEPVEAVRLYGQALLAYVEMQDEGSIGMVFHNLADLLVALGDALPRDRLTLAKRHRHSSLLHGAAEMPLRRAGIRFPEEERLRSDQLQSAARVALGADAYAAAFAEGQAMTLETAVAYAESVVQAITAGASARKGTASPLTLRQAARERYGGVTAREREVAAFVAQGRSNREIAAALVLSERTVETHVTNILNKLGYDSRTQIAAWAVRVGLDS
jgi:non-specific serine/threonine protein kinase